MSSVPAHPHLRLVRPDEADDPGARARWEVAGENRAAAANTRLDPTDPRWVLAVRAYTQLQGSALTLDRRRRVMRLARQLGIRPFDASLIIAIAQDRARRGDDLAEAAGTLAILDKPGRGRPARGDLARWVAVLATATVANALLIWWLTG